MEAVGEAGLVYADSRPNVFSPEYLRGKSRVSSGYVWNGLVVDLRAKTKTKMANKQATRKGR